MSGGENVVDSEESWGGERDGGGGSQEELVTWDFDIKDGLSGA